MAKNPYMPLYIGDYLKDTRILPMSARGGCVDLMLYMWENDPRGELTGTIEDFSRIMGCSIQEAQDCLFLLKEKKIFTWGELPEENKEGKERGMIRIISRKQKRMAALHESRVKTGKEGGNPKLGVNYHKEGYIYAMRRGTDGYIKIGGSTQPNKRIYKIREQQRTSEIFVIGALFVADMAAQEQYFHNTFQQKKEGDWFNLNENELAHLLSLLKEKNNSPLLSPQGKMKGNPEYENEYKEGEDENKGGKGEKGEGEEGGRGNSPPPIGESPGWNQFPGEADVDLELPEAKAQAAQELLVLGGQKAEPEHIGRLWKIFKTQHFAGTKFYNSKEDVFSHFINWSKTQKVNGTEHQTNFRTIKQAAGNGLDPTVIVRTGFGKL